MAKQIKSTSQSENRQFAAIFGKTNYIIMLAGIVLLGLGYILLCGGGSDDPNVFNPAMFNARRLVVAPLMIILGLVAEIVAIMYKGKEE